MTDNKIGEPFAGYTDFADCVAKNQDKNDPEGYCAVIMRQAETTRRCSICGQYISQDLWQQHWTGNHSSVAPAEHEEGLYLQNRNKSSQMGRLDELGLVAFQMDSRLAVPTISGNKRKWTEKELRQAAPQYIGKPVMLDHSQGTGDVVAVTTDSYWGTSRVRPTDTVEALRAHSIGLMDKALFEKVRTDGKNVIGIPLIKGLSIAGGADLVMDESDGTEIPTNFTPDEYSITPFPGIKEAEIERMVPIMESLKKKKTEGLKTKLQESQLPEFIPIFLLPKRGESCPEGYTQQEDYCIVPQQMNKLAPEIVEYLKKGAPGYTLVSDIKNKPLIYVKNQWMQQAVKAVDETGRPSKEWLENCIAGVEKSGTIEDSESVSTNVWFNLMGEWAKQRMKTSLEKKIEFQLPPEAKEAFTKLADQLRQEKVKVPENLFTTLTREVMSVEEQASFDKMLLDMERQKYGLPPLEEGQGNTETLSASKEKVTTQKIIEQLTEERDQMQEKLAKVDSLKMERDQLQKRLEAERGLWKAIENGRRLPVSTGKGKALTQASDTIASEKIESSDDATALYEHYVSQGLSRKDASQAVLLRIMEQSGIA